MIGDLLEFNLNEKNTKQKYMDTHFQRSFYIKKYEWTFYEYLLNKN